MCPTTGKPADSAPVGGEPIIIASGQLVEHAVDYESAGPFPLRVERFYLSNPWTNMFLNSLVSPSPWIPASGGTWRTNFDASVQWSVGSGSNSAPQYVYVALPDMSPNSDGTYVPAVVNSSGGVSAGGKGVEDALTLNQSAQTFTVVAAGGVNYVIKFSATSLAANASVNSELVAINFPGGYSQSLAYDPNSRLLTTVTDSLGRNLGFTYGSSGAGNQLASVTTNGATVVTYTYVDKTDPSLFASYFPGGVVPAPYLSQTVLFGGATRTATGETTSYAYDDPKKSLFADQRQRCARDCLCDLGL
jgi:hypothetical protein